MEDGREGGGRGMRWSGSQEKKDREIAEGLKTEIKARGGEGGEAQREVAAGKSSKNSDNFWCALKEQTGRRL